jgi:hypothetical protein
MKHLKKPKNVDSFNEFVRAKPGFVLAFAVFALILIFTFYNPSNNFEELTSSAMYAKQASTAFQSDVNYVISSIDAEIASGFEATLEDDYFYSFKSDMQWLSEKEKSTFVSQPSKDVLVKEIALTLVMEDMLSINEDAGYDFDFTDYDTVIDEAKILDYNYKTISIDSVKTLFEGEDEKFKVFEKAYNEIMMDYFNQKKALVNSDASKERRFIEAKKVIYVYYI